MIFVGPFQMDRCEWTQCLRPTIPASHNLELLTTFFPVDINEAVTVACQSGFFFERDREKEEFEGRCLKDNKLDFGGQMPSCIKSE